MPPCHAEMMKDEEIEARCVFLSNQIYFGVVTRTSEGRQAIAAAVNGFAENGTMNRQS
jgi:hypothetical protein